MTISTRADTEPDEAQRPPQLPNDIHRHIVSFALVLNPQIAETSKPFLNHAERFAEDEIRRQVNGSRVDVNWSLRLGRPTKPWRLLLQANAVRSVALSEYILQPSLGPVHVQPDGKLVSVSHDQTLRILDITAATTTRPARWPGISADAGGMMGVLFGISWITDHLYTANDYVVLHRPAGILADQEHTIYVLSPLLNYSISLITDEVFQEIPNKSFSLVVTSDGKLVVVAYDGLNGTGGKVVCFDIATRSKGLAQDLHDLLSIPTDERNLRVVNHKLVIINEDMFLLRYSEERGQNGSTGIYLLNFSQGGSSLSLGSFRPLFEGLDVHTELGHHSGWSNSKWLVYRSFPTSGKGSAVKALSWTGSHGGSDDAGGHDIHFEGDRQEVLLVVGDRLIVQDPDESGEVILDEVCIDSGKVLRTMPLGCSRDDFMVSSVVTTNKELVCVLSRKPAQYSVIKTFVL